jgi:MoxR-like ATPase
VEAADIQATAAARGLRIDVGVYANAAAALASGRHVVLVGPAGAGKTTLALAVAKAAVDAGKAEGAALISGADPLDQHVFTAARRNRWLVVDELDVAALAPLSTFLSHLPVTLAGEDGEVAAPQEWRIVATAAAVPADAPAAVLGRLAFVEVPAHDDLNAAIEEAAGGDAVAAAAVARLLPLREVGPLGAGPFLAAARHAAGRRAAADTDQATLTREVYTAYLAPLLGELDAAAQLRVQEALGGR